MENNKKKEINNFSENLKTYIVSNDLTYEEFAKKLNLLLVTNNHCGKTYYDGKDIRSFAYRSYPRDMVAMVMIAKILGKDLSDLITKTFTYEEMRDKGVKSGKLSKEFKEKLNTLTDEEYIFLVAMASTAVRNKESYHKKADIGVFYFDGISVCTYCYIYNGKFEVLLNKWDWAEYGKRIAEYNNDEMFAIECEIRDKFLDKLEKIGFVKDYFCTNCSLEKEQFSKVPDKIFSLDVYFNFLDEEYEFLVNELKSNEE